MSLFDSRSVGKFQTLAQVAIAEIALVSLGSVWFGFWRDVQLVPDGFGLVAFVILAGVAISRWGNAPFSTQGNLVRLNSIVSRQVLLIVILMTFTLTALSLASISIFFILSYAGIIYTVLLITHRPVQNAIIRLLAKETCLNSLVVGNMASNYKLIGLIKARVGSNFQFECYTSHLLDEKQPESEARDSFFLELRKFVKDKSYGELLLSQIPENSDFGSRIVEFCNQTGIRLFIVSDLHEKLGHSLHLVNNNGIQLICLREEPLSDPFNQMLKRLFDLGVASLALILLFPLCVLIFLVHRFQSPGPLFFVQRRSGLRNNEFNIFKFRSLTVQSDFSCGAEDRRFPFGRFMRRHSLDEFPQFINVLKGEMSIVGPRPHMIEHNQEFENFLSNYNVRSFVKPGVTGLAQVRGYRGETDSQDQIEKRVESDIFYIENWTFMLDILIVLRTIGQILLPPRSAF